jgi:hypothetical protein
LKTPELTEACTESQNKAYVEVNNYGQSFWINFGDPVQVK